jgi:hypothetical protein
MPPPRKGREAAFAMSHPELNKPSWLSGEAFQDFIAVHRQDDGTFRCKTCGELADTIDHIVPRSDDSWKGKEIGAADQLSNLQPMCRKHNSSKGVRPDSYWSKTFLFDRQLNTENLRASQNDFVYQAIREYGDSFSRPFNQINGKLFCFFQCVGAGKTLGMLALPYALNHSILGNAKGGHKPPRVDRMLVLVKDQQLREQIGAELLDEPFKFKITPSKPRVLIARSSSDLEKGSTGEYDIVVACQQTIWPRQGSSIACRWELLHRFPVIAFDEMHWAADAIQEVVYKARNSLCFGFTASPVDAAGVLMDDIVKVSVYGYQAALINDNSMRGLGVASFGIQQSLEGQNEQGDHLFNDIIDEVFPESVVDIDGTLMEVNAETAPMGDELPYCLNVANRTVEEVTRLDGRRKSREASGHRWEYRSPDIDEVKVSLDFPVHAMIRVNGITKAEYVKDYLNAHFESDRKRYPLEKGYMAVCAHGGKQSRRDDETSFNAQPLDQDTSPWFKVKRDGGKLSEGCARFLIVDSLAKEGTNNAYCTVVAFAKPVSSQIEIVQSVGRGIRSIHKKDGSTLHVPDRYLDNLRVLTHSSYGSLESIRQGLRFIRSMDHIDEGVPSLDQWFGDELQGASLDEREDEEGNDLPGDLLDRLIARLASDARQGKRVSVPDYKDLFGKTSRKRRKAVGELVEGLVREDPDTQELVRQRLRLGGRLHPDLVGLLKDEHVDLNKQGDAAVSYLLDFDFGSQLEEMFERSGYDRDQRVAFCEQLVPKVRSNDYSGQQVQTKVDLTTLVRSIAMNTVEVYRLDDLKSEVFKLTTIGVKILLGKGADYTLGKGCSADTPAVILKLSDRTIQKRIKGFVLRRLVNEGALDDVAAVVGLTPEQGEEVVYE